MPIIVAAFADEEQVHETLARLEALNVGRDLIGVCARVNGRNGHTHESVHLLSVMVSLQRREEIEALLVRCDALFIGRPPETRAAFGLVPHPGVFEDGGLKLPMGPEYYESTNRNGGV